MSSRSLAVISTLLWVSGPLLGCAAKPAAPPPPPSVSVAPALEREIAEWDEFSGRFEAVDQVEIRPRVSGYIKRIAFAEGKDVRKGEVLVEIDPRPYRADLDARPGAAGAGAAPRPTWPPARSSEPRSW